MLDRGGGALLYNPGRGIGLGPAKKQGGVAKQAKNDGQDSRNCHLAQIGFQSAR
jgi:hypothetical protein